MNKEMAEGVCILQEIPRGNITLTTYPNGSFEISVLDVVTGNGMIVAEGNWKGYDKDLTDEAWNHLVRGK